MTDEQKLIYEWIGMTPVIVPDWDRLLPEMYDSFNAAYFNNSLPSLSSTFVCEFCEMPREAAGIFLDADRAARRSTDSVKVKPGIRINSKLKELTDHVKISLLHEMIHASGINGHGENFQNGIIALLVAGAYRGLL